MSSSFQIQLIAVVIAIACALPGNFLVLRKMSMMTDSITHTVLLGIVIAFLVVEDLNSPYLIIGATIMGVITVWLTETVTKTKLVSEDSAIGIVFPLLFSIAIILISMYAGSVHLDTDSVLLGELAFAPFDRLVINGINFGPKALYTGAVVLIANIVFIKLFFKELQIVTFDAALAAAIGFSPVLIHYGLMTMVSLTAVAAFESVGSILVVAFMIGPANIAYLLTDNLKTMIKLSALFAALSGIIGFQFAKLVDVSIAGSMAVAMGLIFAIVFLCAPNQGLVSVYLKKKQQKQEFAQMSIMFHIHNHQYKNNALEENGLKSINNHLQWDVKVLENTINTLVANEKVIIKDDTLFLTPKGEESTETSIKEIFSNRN